MVSLALVLMSTMVCSTSESMTLEPVQEDHLARLAEFQRRADDATRSGDSAAALVAVQKGLLLDPAWRYGLWGAGALLYQTGEYSQAIDRLSALTKLDPEQGAPWALLGLCEFELGVWDAAREHLARGLTLGVPAKLELKAAARFSLAGAHLKLSNFETAAWVLQPLVRERKGDCSQDELALAMGLAALRIPLLPSEAAGKLAPGAEVEAQLTGEAMCQGVGGSLREAQSTFRRLFERYPRLPNVHYAYATLLLDAADFTAAEAELNSELSIQPGSVPAGLGLAFAALETGALESGLQAAEEAARLDPGSYLAHLYLGRLRTSSGRPGEAIPELELACRLAPASSKVRFALATAYRLTGRAQEAAVESREFQRLKVAEEAQLEPVRTDSGAHAPQ